jgi:hypothetical protein
LVLDQLSGVDVPRWGTEYAPHCFDLGVVGDAEVLDRGAVRVRGPREVAVSVGLEFGRQKLVSLSAED